MTSHRLAGRRVLVTRAMEDSQRWAKHLAAHGADPVLLPCVRSEPLDDSVTRAQLASACRDADWLLFTSVRGVDAVARTGMVLAPRPYGGMMHRGGGTPATVLRAIRGVRRHVTRWARVAGALGRRSRHGASSSLAPKAARYAERYWRAGARGTRVNVYRTLPAPPVSPRRDLEQEGIDDVLLASPSAVTGLLNQARVGATTRCFTIGPTTSAAARSVGLVVTGESATPDLNGLMEAMQCTIGA